MKAMKFLSGAVVVSLLAFFTSCEELNNGGEVIQPDDQKVKLEDVAVELMTKCPASDLEKYVDIYDNFYREYLEDETYDFGALENFGEDALDESFTEKDDESYDEAKKEYFNKSVVNIAVALSNHKGEFTFGRNAVIKDSGDYDGVKVNIPLGSKTYAAELTSSGKVTVATYNYLYGSYGDYYDGGYWDDTLGEWVESTRTETYEEDVTLTIDVPEKIEIGLYEDGEYLAKVTIVMTKNFTAAGLNPAVDNFNANVKVVLDNGYEIVIDKVSYDGSKSQAGSSVKFVKDGVALVSSSASADVKLINSKYTHENESYNHRCENTTVKVEKAKNVSAVIDILGKVQIKGSCSNAKEAYDSMEAYWDALRTWDDETGSEKTPDETTALRHLGNLNAKLNLGVYYDGNATRQATVVFEMDKEVDDAEWDRNGDGVITAEDSYVYYDILPVIVFGDGSRYTLEDYFTEEAFENLLNRLDDFGEEYEDLLGTICEVDEPLIEELH